MLSLGSHFEQPPACKTRTTGTHMRTRVYVTAICCIALAPLYGCESLRDAERNMVKYRADPIIAEKNETVDVIAIISNGTKTTAGIAGPDFDKELQALAIAFEGTNAPQAVARRNLLQDRLRIAADARCEEYKTIMFSKQARANFWLGATSLLFGAAGAATSTIDVARSFAGASALFTGVRSEYNQSYYLDKTITVLTKAITQRQTEAWTAIDVNRSLPVAQYSVLQAIRDVSKYHSACSLTGALELADKAIESYDVNRSISLAVERQRKLDELKTLLKSTVPIDSSNETAAPPSVPASGAK
jgi:hypothetical protein